MDERAALITGGSSGIGLAIARALAEAGYGVTIAARRATKLERAAEWLRGDGGDVQGVRGDVAEEGDVVELVRRHRDRFGRLDVLINGAGVGYGSPIAEQSTKRLDAQIGVNIRGTYLVTRESLPMLMDAGGEHGKALVVNMSSLAGKSGTALMAGYSGTKAGIVGFTQALHKEHSANGIHATAICPSLVDTAMSNWARKAVPKEEMIRPEDVAAAVRYRATRAGRAARRRRSASRPRGARASAATERLGAARGADRRDGGRPRRA